MRLTASFILLLLNIAVVCSSLLTLPARAASFTESSLRFSRLATNTANVQVLVVVKPASSATEAQITLTLASAFTVNSTPSNVTASTDDLPATYQGEALTAWPGIGSNATAVSGQNVTFASDDLDAGTLYGFYVTSGINTPSSVGSGEFTHTIATKTAGSSVIDQNQITTAVESNDQVTITGVIPGTTITADRDFGIRVTTTTTDDKVPPDTVRTYTVTYENNAETDFDIRLEAEWTRGQSADSEHHSFDVVSYVPGSAGKAYGNVTPVIDLDRRIISWTIPAFSKTVGTQTVEFQLRTADNTLSTLPLNYEIKARIVSGDATKEAESLGQTYTPLTIQPSPTPVPSISPSPAPSGAPTASPTPSPTTSPAPVAELKITDVSVIDIGDTSFSLRVLTNQPATVTANWGSTPSLGQGSITSPTNREHILTFTELQPGTTYYIQLSAANEVGDHITLPELFTVTTATRGLPSVINEQGVSALAYGIALFQGVARNNSSILLPTGTPLAITIPFTESTNADVAIRIHSDQVLGLRVPAALPFQEFSPLSQATDKLYSGYVMTPHQTGTYTVTVRVRTPDGILYQLPVATLRMTDPLTIRDTSGNPIESARLTIEQWHERDRVYAPAEHLNFGVSLPYSTDADGQVPAVLGLGNYRLRVRAAGYEETTHDLLFNPYTDTAYPVIELTPNTSFIGRLEYSSGIIGDTAHFGRWSLGQLAHSHRFIQLLTVIAVSAAAVLSILLVRFYATKETGQRRLTHLRNTLIRSVGHTALIILWALTLFVALQSSSTGLSITILFTATIALALWIWLTAIARIKPIHEYWQ